MKKNVQAVIILILLSSISSCSKNNNVPFQIFNDGKLIASVFKNNNKEYHVWTKEELKDSKDALTIRNRLNIEKEFVTYFYSDSTLDEGHYYASYQSLFRKNPIINSEKTPKQKTVSLEHTAKDFISELNTSMNIDSKAGIISFLDIVNRGKNLTGECGNEHLKNEIKSALVTFQKRCFPKARKAYYQNAKNELWEKDIDVSISGKDITFTGYMFVKNKVIKNTYLEIKDEISDLRFNTVGFRAFDGDDRTYWELNSKKDSEI